jgi:hypothetical protein
MEFMVHTIDPPAINLLPQNDARSVKIVSNPAGGRHRGPRGFRRVDEF